MGDDELDEASKLKIAANFINYSPPGQIQKVVEDVKVLLGGHVPRSTLDSLMVKVNSTSFLAVDVPGEGRKVLITPFGDLGDGTFLDPMGLQRLTIDHGKQVCTSAEALSGAEAASLDAPEKGQVDAAMTRYAANKLPDAVVTTYCKIVGGATQITSCIGRCDLNLSNYWAGLWRSHWVLEFTSGSKSGTLKGTVHSNVHYFEDGNVQLDDRSVPRRHHTHAHMRLHIQCAWHSSVQLDDRLGRLYAVGWVSLVVAPRPRTPPPSHRPRRPPPPPPPSHPSQHGLHHRPLVERWRHRRCRGE